MLDFNFVLSQRGLVPGGRKRDWANSVLLQDRLGITEKNWYNRREGQKDSAAVSMDERKQWRSEHTVS